MFNYEDIIKRAISFFPKWTNIRKRYQKSNGGKLLASFTDEVMDIEQSLKEYIESYFLDTYFKSYDDVVAFVFTVNVGKISDISLLEVGYKGNDFSVTDDVDYFYKNIDKNIVYYEEGNLYIGEHHVTDPDDAFEMIYDEYSSTYTLTKINVWNIFDEYACFVGLTRHNLEKNSELVNRILYRTKNLPNSSKTGLKDAIISKILTYYPDITHDDIEVDGLTPEYLLKPYKAYTSLLDMLNEMNRDILDQKRWDLDMWQYNFKSIEYIDNKWDESVASFQNGIGSGDDLKVIVADASQETDATVTLYDKSEEMLIAYVQNKNINKNIKLKLRRFNNIVNSVNVKYRIKASTALEITNEDIELSIYEDDNRTEKRYVQDLYKFGKSVVKIDNSKLIDNNRYRLEFVAGKADANMSIDRIKISYRNRYTGQIVETVNLLKQAPGFTLNAEGSLVNNAIKKSIRHVSNFNSYTGLYDSTEGIALAPNSDFGQGIVSVSGLGLNYITLQTDYKMSILPKDVISLNPYAFWHEDVINFRYDIPQQRTFDLKVSANIVSFDIMDNCNLDVFLDDDGVQTWTKIQGPTTFKTAVTDKARNIHITVISNDDHLVRFNNFQYADYEVNLKLQTGNILNTNGQLMLPNFASNSLIVELRAKSGSSPVIKGIYIGADLSKATYRTEIIQNKQDCDRLFDIKSNCQINLLQVNEYGTVQRTISDFEPIVSYKATDDTAYIRLNIDEYSSIEEMITNGGSVSVTNESGVDYYDIKLKNNDIVSNVIIKGSKRAPARVVTLHDIIKLHEPRFDVTTDKLYCSKAADGIILEFNQGSNPYRAIIKIKSSVFAGINASKYEFTKIPITLGTIFGSNIGHSQSYDYTGSFDYISIYPGSAQIHEAINEHNMYTSEMRAIKIVNNFAPVINLNDMLFYTVESMNSDNDIHVKFADKYEVAHAFDVLNNWTIGYKDIAIKTNIDLGNSDNYDISAYEVEENTLLSKYIELKNIYTLSNNAVISLDQCVIEPMEGIEIKYKTYDGSSETTTLIKQEEIIVEADGFNKLKYSNIDTILYIGTEPFAGVNNVPTEYDHTLLKDEGLIVWNNDQLVASAIKLYIRYTTKLPIALIFDNDALYREINYHVDAYKEMYKITLQSMQNNQRFDLKTIDNFENVDLVFVECQDPSFDSVLSGTILKFRKIAAKDSLLVKTGYYYINGKEYYLYSNKGDLVIDKPNLIETRNVEVSGGELTLVKATNNYVRNSEMVFRGISELYDFDCTTPLTYGISKLNTLTACNTFNGWVSFNSKIYFEDGLNDIAITFSPNDETGFSYLDITDHFKNGDYLSFWATQKLNVFIGKEAKYMDLSFSRALNIQLDEEIKSLNDDMRFTQLEKEEGHKYYLIVRGQGTIDDIIISESEVHDDTVHKKNIDKLGLKVSEPRIQGSVYRMDIRDNRFTIEQGADLSSDGKITMVSDIDWGLTTFKSYETREDFVQTTNEHVDIQNDFIKTSNREGYIMTEALYINNPLAIKRLFFKINSIDFDYFKGFKTSIFTSTTKNGVYSPVSYFTTNHGFVYGDYLGKYVKVKIEMPKGKMIDNFAIFIEYRSDENNYPTAVTPNTGSMLSKVYDLNENVNCSTRSIKIDSISNINDVEISLRASRYEYSADVWMDWKVVEITPDLKIKAPVKFEHTRFLQMRIKLKTKSAYIHLKYLDIEVI